jgi:hypothetical protein
MGRVVIEICAPAAPAPMAKVKKSKEKNPENWLMENMERELQRREAMIMRLEPNRVASIPLIREKRRYPRRIPPLRSPISI